MFENNLTSGTFLIKFFFQSFSYTDLIFQASRLSPREADVGHLSEKLRSLTLRLTRLVSHSHLTINLLPPRHGTVGMLQCCLTSGVNSIDSLRRMIVMSYFSKPTYGNHFRFYNYNVPNNTY